MEIFKFKFTQNKFSPSVIALGFFDGVHLAHQEIIKKTLNHANFLGYKSLVFTFKDHPILTINSRVPPFLISTFEEKIDLIGKIGIDYLCWADFTKNFAKINPIKFVKNILVDKLGAQIVVAGHNYHFGYKAKGNIKLLKDLGKEYGFIVDILKPIYKNKKLISSTLIRKLISNGKLGEVKEYLGRYYSIFNKVKKGKGRGKKLLIKTANLTLPKGKSTPPKGVYAVLVKKEARIYQGIANLGVSPTFGKNPLTLEVNLFNFKKEIYGEYIEVFFVEKLRKEIKFKSYSDLAEKIKEDILKARKILQEL